MSKVGASYVIAAIAVLVGGCQSSPTTPTPQQQIDLRVQAIAEMICGTNVANTYVDSEHIRPMEISEEARKRAQQVRIGFSDDDSKETRLEVQRRIGELFGIGLPAPAAKDDSEMWDLTASISRLEQYTVVYVASSWSRHAGSFCVYGFMFEPEGRKFRLKRSGLALVT